MNPNLNADYLMQRAIAAGVTDPAELANFMGQMQVESGGFTHLEENLHYSGSRLLAVFRGRNGIDNIAMTNRIVAEGPEVVGNAVYGGGWGRRRVTTKPGLAATLVLTCMLMSACSASNGHESTYAVPQHANTVNAMPAASRIVAARRSGDRGRSIRETCGGATVVLQCAGSGCTSTSLRLMTDHGKALTVANPSGLESYSAVGLGCAIASDQTPYVVVQYGELPTGCEFCEWFHVLDAKGQWLTHSVPAILVDRALPGTRDQVPNNREFNAFSRKWKLGKPHITFIR